MMDDLTARIEALLRRYGTVDPRAGRLDEATPNSAKRWAF
jgi:hypothetical protein